MKQLCLIHFKRRWQCFSKNHDCYHWYG